MYTPDFQPILTGTLVTLRPVKSDDWEGLFAAASNPNIWSGHPNKNRFEKEEFRAFFDDALASNSAFTIIDKTSNAIIGSSRYHAYSHELSEVEIGWTFIACEYWGGTYNFEIKRLMLEHAFSFAKTVLFWVGEENYRSQKAMKKIGGALRAGDYYKMVGQEKVPYVIFEIKYDNYLTGPFMRP